MLYNGEPPKERLLTSRCQAVAAFQCGKSKTIRSHNHIFPSVKRAPVTGLELRHSPFRDKRNHPPEVSFARAINSSLQTSTSSSQSRDDVSSSSPCNENNSRIAKLLGNEWGSNGAQLVLPLEVLVTADVSTKQTAITTNNKAVQMAWPGGKPTGSIEFISQN
ncbi:hypothetical protein HJC23_008059 [Cyclotella cryptica]|uniref:Uncharacterized protein n=1 Tax=Cyclotella cryptica TaxID=29204 RepID=A0ABD3NTW4_9STRA